MTPILQTLQAWGQEFTIETLWNDPRCFCSSVDVLRQRLKKYSPEEACIPSLWRVFGRTFKTLYDISKYDKCEVPYPTLRDRVGRMKMPIHLAVKSELEGYSPGGISLWHEWLEEHTIISHGCIILINTDMPVKLMCHIYEAMQTGRRQPGRLINKCGNPGCINPAHYKRSYPRGHARKRGWVDGKYIPKSGPGKTLAIREMEAQLGRQA